MYICVCVFSLSLSYSPESIESQKTRPSCAKGKFHAIRFTQLLPRIKPFTYYKRPKIKTCQTEKAELTNVNVDV